GYLIRSNFTDKYALKLLYTIINGLLRCQIHTIWIGEWCPVYFWSVRSKAILIWFHFGSHGHGHQGATMEGIVKNDDRWSACSPTCDLDRVFDSLSPAIKE